MSPHPCTDCFLFETRGVCLLAQEAYGLETLAEVQQRAEALRLAIVMEASTVPSFRELVRLDAERQRSALLLPTPAPLVLPEATAERIPNDSGKEPIRVLASRTTR
jgi:hypothetical protein